MTQSKQLTQIIYKQWESGYGSMWDMVYFSEWCLNGIADFCKTEKINLVVVGLKIPLVMIAD